MSTDDDTDFDPATAPVRVATQPASAITRLADSQLSPAARNRRPSQLDLAIGEKLGGRYVVRGFLGMGGMGAVYHVFDETLGQEVALKAVRSAIATTTGLRDEVVIAQKITHENVCRTYDLEDLDGRHFVKMEYVAGETLAERIGQGRVPIDEAIRIARGVAAGLAAAHLRGIVHRDLKPGNVMLERRTARGERVVLMDFGLAQYANRSDVDRAGTPGYMSPEQLAGVALDHRSDLFALGCLLHEMLTGERVYGTGSMTEIENRQSSIEIPEVRSKRPETPKWLSRATLLLLSKDREQRPAGLALLNRGPASKAPIAIAAVGIAVVGTAIAWVALRPAAKPWQAHVEVIRTPALTTELTTRPSFAPDGASFVYIREAIGEAGVVERTALPRTAPPQRVFDAAGGHQIRHLRDGSGFVMCGGEGEAHEVYTLDHKGQRHGYGRGADPDDCGDALIAVREVAAAETYQWQLVEIPKRDGQPRVLVQGETGQVIDHPRCDPAGQRVVFSMFEAEQPAIFVVDRAAGATVTRIAVGETPTFGSSHTVIYSANGKLLERDLGGPAERVLTPDDGSYFAPELSPDGNTLLYQREEAFSALYLGGPAAREREGILIPHERLKIRRAAITRDRKTVIVQRMEAHPAIAAIDVATGKLTPLADGEAPFLSHDDREVYFVGERPSELRAVAITGGPSRAILEVPKAQIRDGHDAADALHLGLASPTDALPKVGGKLRAVRVQHGTRDLVDEGSGIVIPAPSGPWIARAFGFDHELTSSDRIRRIRCFGPSGWLDDHRFGCSVAPRRLEIVDVTDDARHTIELPWLDRFAFLAADGEHWIAVREATSITQLAITNFADRLR